MVIAIVSCRLINSAKKLRMKKKYESSFLKFNLEFMKGGIRRAEPDGVCIRGVVHVQLRFRFPNCERLRSSTIRILC